MKIQYIFKNKAYGPSLYRSFEPMMAELRSQGHEVSELFVPYGGTNPINLYKNIRYVYKHRLRDGVNHITGDVHYVILGLLGVPSVLTIHDDYALRMKKTNFLVTFIKWLLWFFLPIKLADKVICTTPHVKNNIEKIVKRKDIEQCLHQDFSGDFEFTPKAFNKDCPRIFLMGVEPNKNLPNSLKALSRIKCEIHILKKMFEWQKDLADSLGLHYTNLWDLSNEEVRKEYIDADIVLFPSSFEGLGAPILEAQLTGRVVITTNREPMSWVAGKDAAILIDMPEKFEEIRAAVEVAINNDQLRDCLICNGQKNTRRFTLSSILKTYMSYYEQSLKAHNL